MLECWRAKSGTPLHYKRVLLDAEETRSVIEIDVHHNIEVEETCYIALRLVYPERWGAESNEIVRHTITLPIGSPTEADSTRSVVLPPITAELRALPVDRHLSTVTCGGIPLSPHDLPITLEDGRLEKVRSDLHEFQTDARPKGVQDGDELHPYLRGEFLRSEWTREVRVSPRLPGEGEKERLVTLRSGGGRGTIALPERLRVDLSAYRELDVTLHLRVSWGSTSLSVELPGEQESVSLWAPRGNLILYVSSYGYPLDFEAEFPLALTAETLHFTLPAPESYPSVAFQPIPQSKAADGRHDYTPWSCFHEDYSGHDEDEEGRSLRFHFSSPSDHEKWIVRAFKPGRWMAFAESSDARLSDGSFPQVSFDMPEQGKVIVEIPKVISYYRTFFLEQPISPGAVRSQLSIALPDDVRRSLQLGNDVDVQIRYRSLTHAHMLQAHTGSNEDVLALNRYRWDLCSGHWFGQESLEVHGLPLDVELEIKIEFSISKLNICADELVVSLSGSADFDREFTKTLSITPRIGVCKMSAPEWDVNDFQRGEAR